MGVDLKFFLVILITKRNKIKIIKILNFYKIEFKIYLNFLSLKNKNNKNRGLTESIFDIKKIYIFFYFPDYKIVEIYNL